MPPTTTISIMEKAWDEASQTFSAEVRFDHGPPRPCSVRDPFTQADEDLLQWYFEQRLEWPMLYEVRAAQAAILGIKREEVEAALRKAAEG